MRIKQKFLLCVVLAFLIFLGKATCQAGTLSSSLSSYSVTQGDAFYDTVSASITTDYNTAYLLIKFDSNYLQFSTTDSDSIGFLNNWDWFYGNKEQSFGVTTDTQKITTLKLFLIHQSTLNGGSENIVKLKFTTKAPTSLKSIEFEPGSVINNYADGTYTFVRLCSVTGPIPFCSNEQSKKYSNLDFSNAYFTINSPSATSSYSIVRKDTTGADILYGDSAKFCLQKTEGTTNACMDMSDSINIPKIVKQGGSCKDDSPLSIADVKVNPSNSKEVLVTPTTLGEKGDLCIKDLTGNYLKYSSGTSSTLRIVYNLQVKFTYGKRNDASQIEDVVPKGVQVTLSDSTISYITPEVGDGGISTFGDLSNNPLQIFSATPTVHLFPKIKNIAGTTGTVTVLKTPDTVTASTKLEDIDPLEGDNYDFSSTLSLSTANYDSAKKAVATEINVTDADRPAFNILKILTAGYDFSKTQWLVSSNVVSGENLDLIVWWPYNFTQAGYSKKKNLMVLSSDYAVEWNPSAILHEFGHFVQDKAVDFPDITTTSDVHVWDQPTDPHVAYSEGWARFFSSLVRKNKSGSLSEPTRTLNDDTHSGSYNEDAWKLEWLEGNKSSSSLTFLWNLETSLNYSVVSGPPFFNLSTLPQGENTDGAVASSLWDIYDDTPNEISTYTLSTPNITYNNDNLTDGGSGILSATIKNNTQNLFKPPVNFMEFSRNWLLNRSQTDAINFYEAVKAHGIDLTKNLVTLLVPFDNAQFWSNNQGKVYWKGLNFDWIVTESFGLKDNIVLRVTSLSDITLSATTRSYDPNKFPNLAQGQYSWSVGARANVKSYGEGEYEFSETRKFRVDVDTYDPTCAVTSPQYPSIPFTVAISGSDAGSGIATVKVYYNDIEWQVLTSLPRTFTFGQNSQPVALQDGTYSFKCVATDNVGNTFASSPDVVTQFDATPPTLNIPKTTDSTQTQKQLPKLISGINKEYDVQADVVDDESGIDQSSLRFKLYRCTEGTFPSCASSVLYQPTGCQSDGCPPVSTSDSTAFFKLKDIPLQGSFRLTFYAKDNAGNESEETVDDFTVDNVAPQDLCLTVPAQTINPSFNLSWSASGPPDQPEISVPIKYSLQYQEDGGSWVQWMTDTQETSKPFFGSFGKTYAFQLKACDSVNNCTGYVNSGSGSCNFSTQVKSGTGRSTQSKVKGDENNVCASGPVTIQPGMVRPGVTVRIHHHYSVYFSGGAGLQHFTDWDEDILVTATAYTFVWNGAYDNGELYDFCPWTQSLGSNFICLNHSLDAFVDEQDIGSIKTAPDRVASDVTKPSISNTAAIYNTTLFDPQNPEQNFIKIDFDTNENNEWIGVKIYESNNGSKGKLVRILKDASLQAILPGFAGFREECTAERNPITWDGKDENGTLVLPGKYIFEVQAQDVAGNTGNDSTASTEQEIGVLDGRVTLVNASSSNGTTIQAKEVSTAGTLRNETQTATMDFLPGSFTMPLIAHDYNRIFVAPSEPGFKTVFKDRWILPAKQKFGLRLDANGLAGDFDHNDRVDIADFEFFSNSFKNGTLAADINLDGKVNAKDLSILMVNFGACVNACPIDTVSKDVALSLTPPAKTVSTGDIVTMNVQFNSERIAWAQVELNFDPAGLQVVDEFGNAVDRLTPNNIFNQEIDNIVDNVAGKIIFAAGRLDILADLTGVNLVTLRFKVLDPAKAKVEFDTAHPPTVFADGKLQLVLNNQQAVITQNKAVMYFEPSAKSANPGDIVPVKLMVDAPYRMAVYNAAVQYNPLHLSPVTKEGFPLTNVGGILCGESFVNAASGEVVFDSCLLGASFNDVFSGGSGFVEGPQHAQTLYFKVLSDGVSKVALGNTFSGPPFIETTEGNLTPELGTLTIGNKIDETAPVISNFKALPNIISPGLVGFPVVSKLTWEINEPVGKMTLNIRDKNGDAVLTKTFSNPQPPYVFYWSGLNNAGNIVSDGAYTLEITAEDWALNQSETASAVVYVATLPVSYSLDQTTHHKAVVSFGAEEATTGEISYGLTTNYDKKQTDSSLIQTHRVALSELLPDTSYHFKASAQTESGKLGFTPDDILSTLSAPTGTLAINNGAPYTNNRSVTLNLFAEVPRTVSFKEASEWSAFYRVKNESDSAFSSYEPYPHETETVNFTLPEGDGVKTVLIQYKDEIPLWGTQETDIGETHVVSAQIILDATPPAKPVITATRQEMPKILIGTSSTDASGISHFILYRSEEEITEDNLSQALIVSSTLTPKQAAAYVDNTGKPGTTYFYVSQAVDVAGNVSALSDNVSERVDTIFDGVMINNGDECTDSKGAQLTLHATAAEGFEIKGMQLSTDNTDFLPLEPYVTPRPWMLTDNPGVKTVYAKFLDNADKETIVYKDTIIYDPLPPAPPVINAVGNASAKSITVRFLQSTDLCGIKEYRLYRNVAPVTEETKGNAKLIATLTASSSLYTDTNVVFGATYHYAVEAVDKLGYASLSNSDEASISCESPLASVNIESFSGRAALRIGDKIKISGKVRAELLPISLDARLNISLVNADDPYNAKSVIPLGFSSFFTEAPDAVAGVLNQQTGEFTNENAVLLFSTKDLAGRQVSRIAALIWPGGASECRYSQVSQNSLPVEGEGALKVLTLTPDPANVAKGTAVTFTAHGFDENGVEVPVDLTFPTVGSNFPQLRTNAGAVQLLSSNTLKLTAQNIVSSGGLLDESWSMLNTSALTLTVNDADFPDHLVAMSQTPDASPSLFLQTLDARRKTTVESHFAVTLDESMPSLSTPGVALVFGENLDLITDFSQAKNILLFGALEGSAAFAAGPDVNGVLNASPSALSTLHAYKLVIHPLGEVQFAKLADDLGQSPHITADGAIKYLGKFKPASPAAYQFPVFKQPAGFSGFETLSAVILPGTLTSVSKVKFSSSGQYVAFTATQCGVFNPDGSCSQEMVQNFVRPVLQDTSYAFASNAVSFHFTPDNLLVYQVLSTDNSTRIYFTLNPVTGEQSQVCETSINDTSCAAYDPPSQTPPDILQTQGFTSVSDFYTALDNCRTVFFSNTQDTEKSGLWLVNSCDAQNAAQFSRLTDSLGRAPVITNAGDVLYAGFIEQKAAVPARWTVFSRPAASAVFQEVDTVEVPDTFNEIRAPKFSESGQYLSFLAFRCDYPVGWSPAGNVPCFQSTIKTVVKQVPGGKTVSFDFGDGSFYWQGETLLSSALSNDGTKRIYYELSPTTGEATAVCETLLSENTCASFEPPVTAAPSVLASQGFSSVPSFYNSPDGCYTVFFSEELNVSEGALWLANHCDPQVDLYLDGQQVGSAHIQVTPPVPTPQDWLPKMQVGLYVAGKFHARVDDFKISAPESAFSSQNYSLGDGFYCSNVSTFFTAACTGNFNEDFLSDLWVKARDGSVEGVARIKIVPDTEPPSQIQDLQASLGPRMEVDLTWSPATDNFGVAKYILYRHQEEITTENKKFAFKAEEIPYEENGEKITSYTDHLTQQGQTYFYALDVVDTSNNVGALSNNVNVSVPEFRVTDLQATPNDGISLSWSEPSTKADIESYQIYRDTQSFENVLKEGALVFSEDFSSGVLDASKFQVLSQVPDTQITADKGYLEIKGPQENVTFGGNVFIKLNQNFHVTDRIVFEIDERARAKGGDFAVGFNRVSASQNIFGGAVQAGFFVSNGKLSVSLPDGTLVQVGQLEPDSLHRYKVAYTKQGGHVEWYVDGEKVHEADDIELTDVTFLFGAAGGDGLLATFDNVKVYQGERMALTSYAEIPGTQKTYGDIAVAINNTYFYGVTAKDSTGKLSLLSNKISAKKEGVTDVVPPAQITDLQAVQGAGTKVFLSWSLPEDDNEVYGYRLYKSQDAITEENPGALTFSFISNYSASPNPEYLNLTSFVDTAVSVGETWHYAIAAVDVSGNVAPLSNIARLTIQQKVFSPEILVQTRAQAGVLSGALALVKKGSAVLSQVTDMYGYARFPVDAGTYTVQVKKPGYIEPAAQTVSVESTDSVKSAAFLLTPYTSHVQGVVTSQGAPLSGATLVAFNALKGERVESVSKEDGSYDLAVSTGVWKVTATKDGFISQERSGINIPENQTVVTGVDFDLVQYASKIKGVVTNENGEPLPSITVKGDGAFLVSATTDANGVYEITIAPATWIVSTQKYGFAASPAFQQTVIENNGDVKDNVNFTLTQLPIHRVTVSGVEDGAIETVSSGEHITITAYGKENQTGLFAFFVDEESGVKIHNESIALSETQPGVYTATSPLPPIAVAQVRARVYWTQANSLLSENVLTLEDKQPPTAPQSLVAALSADLSVSLNWDGSTDNVGVKNYVVLRHTESITPENVSQAKVLTNTLMGFETSFTDEEPKALVKYYYAVFAKDYAGNTSPLSNVVSVQFRETQPPSAVNDLQAVLVNTQPNQVQLTWSGATDNVGVVRYKVLRIENEPITGANKLLATILTNTLTSNTRTFLDETVEAGKTYYYAVTSFDAAGNESALSNSPFVIIPSGEVDTIAPVISNVVPPDGSFVNSIKPLISTTVIDADSGVNPQKVFVKVDETLLPSIYDALTQKVTVTFLESQSLGEGLHTLKITALDNAGNTASSETTFTVDVTAPLVVITNPLNGSFVSTKQFNVTAQLTDTLSGIDASTPILKADGVSYPYSYDETTGTLTYAWPPDIQDGVHEVTLDVKDKAGNSAQQAKSTFTVDTTLPQIVNISDSPDPISSNNSFGIKDATTITADIVENNLQEWKIAIKDASGTLKEFAGTTTPVNATWNGTNTQNEYLTDGLYRYVVTVKDRALNETASEENTITIDNTNPTAALEILGPQFAQSGNLFVSGNKQLAIQGNDPVVNGVSAGVERTYYAVDQEQTLTTYTTPFTLEEGPHTVRYSAKDNAGNESPQTFTQVVVDATPPVTNISSQPQAFTKTKTFTLSATDPLIATFASGVQQILYSLDGLPFTTYISGLTLSDGYHTLEYFAVDNVGNEEQHHIATFAVDTTKPEVTNISDAPDPFSPANSPGAKDTSTITASVNEVNPDTWKLQLFDAGNNPVQNFSGTGSFISQLWNGSISSGGVAPDGLYSYQILATDRAGNTNKEVSGGTTETKILLQDDFNDNYLDPIKWNTQALPSDPGLTVTEESGVLRIFGEPQAQNTGDNITGVAGLAQGDVTKKLSVSVDVDVSHSQVPQNGQPVLSLVLLGNPDADALITMNVVVENGVYVLMVQTFSGQQGMLGSIPAQGNVKLSYDPAAASVAIYFNNEQKSVVPISIPDAALTVLAATGSAGSFVDVRFDNVLFTQEETGSGQIVFTPDGYITVDNTHPVSQLTPSVVLFNNQYAPTSATYAVTADDPVVNGVNAGVEKIEVSKDSEPFVPYTSALSLEEGRHTLQHKATDAAGNTEQEKTFSVDVDGTAPSTAFTPSAPLFNNAYAPLATTYALSATDPVSHDVSSGVLKTVYKIDGGEETQYSTALTLTEGEHTIAYFSKDNVLNTETEKTFMVKVDNTAPVIQVISSAPLFANQYAPITTTYTFSSTDPQSFGAASGVSKIEYTLDGGVTNTYTGDPISLTEGVHTFVFYATDNVGNVEQQKTFVVHVDNMPPVTTANAGEPKFSTADKQYVAANTPITLNAIDPVVANVSSGVSSTQYKVDSGNYANYTGAFSLSEGIHTVTFKSTDNVGNTEQEKTQTVHVDNTPPSAQIAYTATNCTANGKTVVSGQTQFTLTGNDPVVADVSSGVKELRYRINGGAWQSYTTAFTLLGLAQDGEVTIEFYAVDNVGNSKPETPNSQLVVLDATPPVAQILSPQDKTVINNTIAVMGTVTESHFTNGSYTLQYGAGQNPSTFTDIATGTTQNTCTVQNASCDPLTTWNTATLTQDTLYTLRLSATDCVGNIATAQALLRIGTPEFAGSFGTHSGGNNANDGEFNQSTGLVTLLDDTNAERVIVSDKLNDRIQTFSDTGQFVSKLTDNLKKPTELAVDASKNIYIVDSQNDRIVKLDKNYTVLASYGSHGAVLGQFNKPYGIALDASGNMYVTDKENNRIQKLDANGSPVREWTGVRQIVNGVETTLAFSAPAGISVDAQGNLYVADSSNNRILKFAQDGTLLRILDATGVTQAPVPDGSSPFALPLGLTLDAFNNLYVADQKNHRVQKFDPWGNRLLNFGTQGTGNNPPDGAFHETSDMALDTTAKFMYVTDVHNHRVQKFAVVIDAPVIAKLASVKNDDKNTIITDPNLLNVLKVVPYPTPSRGKLSFNLEAEGNVTNITLEIYTVTGKRVLVEYLPVAAAPASKGKGKFKAESPSLDAVLSSLPNGVYVYRLQISNGVKTVNKTGKFVVVR